MKQAPFLDGVAFDTLTFEQDSLAPSKPDIGRGEIVQALVIPAVVIIFDECFDLLLEIAWQVVMLKKHAVLEGLVPPLDFSLRLGMVRGAADMIHCVLIQPFREFVGDIARTVIGEQARSMFHLDLIQA
ncbi:hypothetical protein KBA01_31310 [Kozakia baliensis]|nr:hypothetical protein KBA01_31310 [Kozakia baliensis]